MGYYISIQNDVDKVLKTWKRFILGRTSGDLGDAAMQKDAIKPKKRKKNKNGNIK